MASSAKRLQDANNPRIGAPVNLRCGSPAKGMLGRLATLVHSVRVLVEPLLYGLQHMLMLPARDPSVLAGGAALFDRAALTGVGPVTAQN
jgi:hypothetical protein